MILHIALHYQNEEKANRFFTKVLGIKLEKEFLLSSDFSESVFNIKKNIKIKVFSDNKTTFEVFITKIKPKITFEHICLSVENKKELIEKCKKYGVEILTPKRNNKEYLFIRDFSGYLYEIKEIN